CKPFELIQSEVTQLNLILDLTGMVLTEEHSSLTNQPLCRGSGGGTRPPVGGLGGNPPIWVLSKERLILA
ncbi:hypothetical protein, partial [Allocoleopsis sp.]|uniref:hypothetical protein n=1 Tax=Allocoleopsis sp. TaxID=3088169 RepID=UPI002FCFBF91